VRDFKGRGHVLRGLCPIHGGSNPKQFTVNIRQQSWFSSFEWPDFGAGAAPSRGRFALSRAA
jgi:hypothetical protein